MDEEGSAASSKTGEMDAEDRQKQVQTMMTQHAS